MSRISAMLLLCGLAVAPAAGADEYDPLAVDANLGVETLNLTVRDEARNREFPIKVYLPEHGRASEESPAPRPVVLFSHGLGGTCNGSPYLGNHWVKRGYLAVFLQHPGSDDAVWKTAPLGERMAVLQAAASASNLQLRVGDVKALLDQLQLWNTTEGHRLYGLLDLDKVGMSGHSFGAVTTQHTSGQSSPIVGNRSTDPRIRAAIAFSPSCPRAGDPAKAFRTVQIPWLLMTGTNDISPIGGIDVESRLKVYPSLPDTADRYELVLHEAEHSAFTEHRLPNDRRSKNPNHHRLILATSTAFWDAHLLKNTAAHDWLRGEKLKTLLEPDDRWQFANAR